MKRIIYFIVIALLSLPIPRGSAQSARWAATPARAGLSEGTVFTGGKEDYHTFRIPSVIVTPKGTVLAFCEGRKVSGGDSGNIDVVLKRSLDGGKTWGKLERIWDDGANTCGNPCPVIDRTTRTIWLLLTHNLGADREPQIMARTSQGTRTVWVMRSQDDGVTWSRPAEITQAVKKPDWTWYATGPGVGIQLRTGRLLVPCDNAEAGSKQWNSHVIFSDDHGATWQLGGVVGPKFNESQAVELTDGSVLLNMRSYRGSKRRGVALSQDGGVTFAEPSEAAAQIEPVCQASILRLSSTNGAATGPLLFSNPASQFARTNGTVRLSYDDGKTWPVAKIICPGSFAYSCLTELPDRSIGVLFETDNYRQLRFTRFTLPWLTAGTKAPAAAP